MAGDCMLHKALRWRHIPYRLSIVGGLGAPLEAEDNHVPLGWRRLRSACATVRDTGRSERVHETGPRGAALEASGYRNSRGGTGPCPSHVSVRARELAEGPSLRRRRS